MLNTKDIQTAYSYSSQIHYLMSLSSGVTLIYITVWLMNDDAPLNFMETLAL